MVNSVASPILHLRGCLQTGVCLKEASELQKMLRWALYYSFHSRGHSHPNDRGASNRGHAEAAFHHKMVLNFFLVINHFGNQKEIMDSFSMKSCILIYGQNFAYNFQIIPGPCLRSLTSHVFHKHYHCMQSLHKIRKNKICFLEILQHKP